MSVYKYIAQTNPLEAKSLCTSYGFPDANSSDEIEAYLIEIVSQDGENGLVSIMQIHPDREIILDLNNKFQSSQSESESQQNQNTRNFTETLRGLPVKDYYSPNVEGKPIILKNASGKSTDLAKNTNSIILASALIVSLAIILSIKK